jgi:uncharacterized protein (TIGR02145 family)
MKRFFDRVVLVCLLAGITAAISCKKDSTPPVVTTSSPTNITISSVTSGGDVTKSGGEDVTERGVCWSTSSSPIRTGDHVASGKGTGSFNANITGLTPDTKYYIRAYAVNSAGTGYGTAVSFTTTALTAPVLVTTEATSVSFTSVVTGGQITSDGGAAVTVRGVCFSTSASPTVDNDKSDDGTGSGAFTSTLSGLTPSTTYYARAYATNSVGTTYGNEITFTTAAPAVPALTTAEVASITLTTATSGGNITSDGGSSITARGVCWSKTASPTISNDKTADDTGTGTFTSNLASLEAGTTYYVRAYATNSTGTGYGNELSFTTSPVVVPVLTSTAISSVSYTTAVSGGVITSDGGATISAKGVCWATTSNPTISNSKTTNGTGTGTFTSNLASLVPGTTYYLRAYATNSSGTGYGDEISFTTTAVTLPVLTTTATSVITRGTATSGGSITSDGGGTITARGVCYALTAAPTLSNTVINSGTGTGSFTSNLTGLTPSTIYHVRAFATNSAGTTYGNEEVFTTSAPDAPTLSTAAVTSITLTTATTGGSITSDGGATVTARGVCWATTASPTISNSITTDGTGTGNFTSSITGLTPGTVYHIRAYATNSIGTSYGNDVQFTTVAVTVPTLATTVISAVTATSAISGGTITSNGGAAITASGVCWSTTSGPQATGSHTTDGTASGNFTSAIAGLSMGTTYYVRAYATNSAGTAYGNEVIFSSKLADIEGNLYNVVTIGTQVWMAENLRTATLNENTSIPNITNNTTWSTLSTMAYSWYNNDIANKPVYGALYNWFTVNTGNLCPTGWHVPSESEFSTLEAYLGMSTADIASSWAWRGTDEGTRLKSTTGWGAGLNGTNTTGFTALPGGYRYAVDGTFNNYADLAYWWSSTEMDATTAWYRRMDGNQTGIYKAAVFKIGGKFVRCVKN